MKNGTEVTDYFEKDAMEGQVIKTYSKELSHIEMSEDDLKKVLKNFLRDIKNLTGE